MSGSTTDDSVTDLADLDFIVDTDAHVLESVSDMLPYFEDDHAGLKRLVEQADHPREDVYSRGHPLPNPHSDSDLAYSKTNSPDDKLEQMDEFDIDYGMLSPGRNIQLTTVQKPELAHALAVAYNSWLIDTFLDGHERLRGYMVVAPHHPQKGAEEIDRRASEDGIVGITIPSTGMLPPAGYRRYDPIYQTAQDNGLPVLFHGAAGAMTHAFPTQHMWNQTLATDHLISHPFSQMWNLTSLMFLGVPERFPDLSFVFQEAGIGWISYMKGRLDDHYLEYTNQIPSLTKNPSDYMDDQFYFTSQPLELLGNNPRKMAMTIELAGADSIMYSSDIPHGDWDPPEELFRPICGHFDESTVKGIMGETAAELFEL